MVVLLFLLPVRIARLSRAVSCFQPCTIVNPQEEAKDVGHRHSSASPNMFCGFQIIVVSDHPLMDLYPVWICLILLGTC